MTDITSASSQPGPFDARSGASTQRPAAAPATREELVACAELFFFAYRDFTGDPDQVLAEYNFGRAHHRVLHFVYRNPGLNVAQLLDILKITKQSLARVLKQLIDEGFIVQREGSIDRRERLLRVTPKGGRLCEKLTALQVKRLRDALAQAGPGASEAMRRFLFAMISAADQPQVEALIGARRGPAGGGNPHGT